MVGKYKCEYVDYNILCECVCMYIYDVCIGIGKHENLIFSSIIECYLHRNWMTYYAWMAMAFIELYAKWFKV